MNKVLLILFSSVYTIVFAQENERYQRYMDTILMDTKLVTEIDNDNITSFMIYSNFYVAKGFLVENNIPGGTIDNNLPIPPCQNGCNARMEAQPYTDSLFIIKYKWRESKDFIIDTCYLFHFYGSYVAYPEYVYTENIVRQTIFQWSYGPASTDERDVISICIGEERKTIFCEL